VAVVVSFTRGHDASYPPEMIGTAEGPVIIGERYHPAGVEKGSEPTGTRRFGFEWAHRSASNGRVIAGFPEKAIARFSSHRAKIRARLRQLLVQPAGHVDTGRYGIVWAPHHRDLSQELNEDHPWPSHITTPRLPAGTSTTTSADAASREPYGTQHHAQAPLQERVVTCAQNSHRRQRGSRCAENSRMRKKARPWRSAAPLGADLGQLQTRLHADTAGG